MTTPHIPVFIIKIHKPNPDSLPNPRSPRLSSADDRFCALKQADDQTHTVQHLSVLSTEVNVHVSVVIDLRENMVKLNLEQVSQEGGFYFLVNR